MTHLTVSTVIPTYNRADLLRLALQSALPQCLPGDEIIVVDDGSDDDTETMAQSLGANVKYVRTPHLGAGAARNVGVGTASCDLVAFLDSDDEWLPGKIASQRAVMEQLPDVLFTFADFGSISRDGARLRHGIKMWELACLRPCNYVRGQPVSSGELSGLPVGMNPFRVYIQPLYEQFLWSWCVFTSTVMVRRCEAGDALRFPEDTPTYEDVECFARLSRRGLAAFTDCELAMQRQHTGFRLTDSDRATNADTAIRILARVYGQDDVFLRSHRSDYVAVLDAYRGRKFRFLLGQGRPRTARETLREFSHAPWWYRPLTYVPSPLTRLAVARRQRGRERRVASGA